jgi:hypothetical protein
VRQAGEEVLLTKPGMIPKIKAWRAGLDEAVQAHDNNDLVIIPREPAR